MVVRNRQYQVITGLENISGELLLSKFNTRILFYSTKDNEALNISRLLYSMKH